jgi:hypothetical protein
MAAREFFANALDTGDELRKEWVDGFGFIQNYATSFGMENLLLGESENRDNSSAIGQFGEGLKIGALVLARNGRKIEVMSGAKRFIFTVEPMPGFDTDVQTLVVTIEDNDMVNGTMVKWECPLDEFNESRGMFLSLQPVGPSVIYESEKGKILDESGSVYICGVRVQTGLSFLYGYDLEEKSLLNRDRTILDMYKVKAKIASLLEGCDETEVVEKLISNQLKRGDTIDFDELAFNLWPNSNAREVWTETLGRLYGDKVCLTSGVASADARAEYLGYRVIPMGNFTSGMQHCLSIKKSTEIKLEKVTKFVKKLPSTEQRIWRRSLKAFRTYAGCVMPVSFEVSEELDDDVLGSIQPTDGGSIIVVNKNQLKLGFAVVFSILCHEGAHLTSGASDCSAAFEAALDRIILNIAKLTIFKGTSHNE